jgi:Mlc titration factor MtfA (ptsG expression regulator)
MDWNLKAWRRRRTLRRHALSHSLWQGAVARLPVLRGLTGDELARLREWATLFLHAKQMNAAGGLVLTDEMRVMIAAQASLPILNLDLDYYDGWVEVIVYPGEFVPEREYTDSVGLVHRTRRPLSGEAWSRGPVILSWWDATNGFGVRGHNVVIHECAHKLDMLNGGADGFPPLHGDMSRQAWSAAFTAAFDDLRARVAGFEHVAIDPYGAENPAEFFAVMSEAFFEMPRVVKASYPDVYAQLGLFYRQDPAQRMT